MNQQKGLFRRRQVPIDSSSSSPCRQNVLQLCGWTTTTNDRVKCLLEDEEYEKAAAICIFQLNVSRALEVLNEGLQQARREDLGTLILALVGFIRSTTNNDEKNLLNEYSAVTKLFQRPYIRAIFTFILTQDSNDLQYDCVLVRSLRFFFFSFQELSFRMNNSIWVTKWPLLPNISTIHVSTRN